MMANLAQVAGVNALGLVNMIISSARTATTQRRNCEQLAEHVKIIGNLLEKLRSTDLMTEASSDQGAVGLSRGGPQESPGAGREL
ncbi:hypothetical protein Dsin_001321 [Dipteronia sinensis]|uniref:MCAfunc domain-containing protein n=1 Tax=Dipteronia sinensis TaxID=43782 RepID=A0AAE0B511_9ROSI|nr:hypothetical protein Dsin_001321 [Dipteronia sinensis]